MCYNGAVCKKSSKKLEEGWSSLIELNTLFFSMFKLANKPDFFFFKGRTWHSFLSLPIILSSVIPSVLKYHLLIHFESPVFDSPFHSYTPITNNNNNYNYYYYYFKYLFVKTFKRTRAHRVLFASLYVLWF